MKGFDGYEILFTKKISRNERMKKGWKQNNVELPHNAAAKWVKNSKKLVVLGIFGNAMEWCSPKTCSGPLSSSVRSELGSILRFARQLKKAVPKTESWKKPIDPHERLIHILAGLMFLVHFAVYFKCTFKNGTKSLGFAIDIGLRFWFLHFKGNESWCSPNQNAPAYLRDGRFAPECAMCVISAQLAQTIGGISNQRLAWAFVFLIKFRM